MESEFLMDGNLFTRFGNDCEVLRGSVPLVLFHRHLSGSHRKPSGKTRKLNADELPPMR